MFERHKQIHWHIIEIHKLYSQNVLMLGKQQEQKLFIATANILLSNAADQS